MACVPKGGNRSGIESGKRHGQDGQSGTYHVAYVYCALVYNSQRFGYVMYFISGLRWK